MNKPELLNLSLKEVQSLYNPSPRDLLEGRAPPKPKVMCIQDGVYDLTEFWEDHPGGHSVLEEWQLKDGTQAFKDVGHSPEAIQLLEKFRIANLVQEKSKENSKNNVYCTKLTSFLLLLGGIGVGIFLRMASIF